MAFTFKNAYLQGVYDSVVKHPAFQFELQILKRGKNHIAK